MEKKRLRLEVYRPKTKLTVSTDEAMPFFVRLGNLFMVTGGFLSMGTSSAVVGVKSFFHIKKKIDNSSILNQNKKYVELRIKNGK